MRFTISVVLFCIGIVTDAKRYPIYPLQLSSDITITSHLISPDSEYPPRERKMKIYYDYVDKKARADIEEGYEAAKTYIRRYDNKNEYMIRLPPISDCSRAYLGEKMPFPEVPSSEYVGIKEIYGLACDYFIFNEIDSRIHIFINHNTGAPVQLTVASVGESGEESNLLTYDYSNVVIGKPSADLFELPEPYDHSTCTRQVGGFPYLHVFHYFVRF